MTPLLYTTPKSVLPLALSLHLPHSEAEAGLGQDVDEVACVVPGLRGGLQPSFISTTNLQQGPFQEH